MTCDMPRVPHADVQVPVLTVEMDEMFNTKTNLPFDLTYMD